MKNLILLFLSFSVLSELPAQKMHFVYQTQPRRGEIFVVSLKIAKQVTLDALPTSSGLELLEVRVLKHEQTSEQEISHFEFFFLPEAEGTAEIGSIRVTTDEGKTLKSKPQSILVKVPGKWSNMREGPVLPLETSARAEVPVNTVWLSGGAGPKPDVSAALSNLNNRESEIATISPKEDQTTELAEEFKIEKPSLPQTAVPNNREGRLEELSPEELNMKKKKGKKLSKLKKTKTYRL